MSKVAIIYWSGTGNTESMANSVAEGARNAGAEVSVFTPAEFSADKVAQFDALGWGCSAQGDEVLEEYEFEPLWNACAGALMSKRVALFGSYGWGDGAWMRQWEDDCKARSISLCAESVICNEAPGSDDEENCRALGAALAL